MIKKLLTILSIIIFVPTVFADGNIVGTTTEKCSVDNAGNINIVWTGGIENVGKTNIIYCQYETYDIDPPHYYKDLDTCNKERNIICPTPSCSSGSKSNICTGKMCGYCEKSSATINCDSITGASANPIPSSSRINNQRTHNFAKIQKYVSVYEGGAGGSAKKAAAREPEESLFDKFKNPINSINYAFTAVTERVENIVKCTYKYTFHEKGVRLAAGDNCNHSGVQDVTAGQYTISVSDSTYSGDTVYCLQPGAQGPDTPEKYTLDTTFSVSNCKDPLHLKNGGNDVRCGLAHILYQTVTYDSKTNTYKSNNKYSYGAITYALRLWMAAYADKYGKKYDILGNVEDYNKEFKVIDWVPASDSNNDYYRNTAKDIIEALSNNKQYDYNSKKQGVITCNGNSNCSFKKSVELFTSAYKAAFVDTSLFLGGKDFSEEVPVVRNYQSSKTEITTIVEIPESIRKDRTCTEEDYKKGRCYVKIRYFDENGNDITDLVEAKGSCGKEFCTIKREIIDLCESNKVSITTKVYIDGWERNNGYIRFYTHATNPNAYQKMITFAFNLEKCSSTGSEIITEPLEPVCECSPNTCEDLTTKTSMPSTCTSDEYTSGTSNDPSMSCIINACYDFDKNRFDNTEKLNANPEVCKVYCRNEVELILPGQISTYAGMQFQFDLGTLLKNKGKNVIANNISPVHKITGILNHKRQCTSEIDYDSWEEKYKAYLSFVDNSNNYKQQLLKWIYELQNCNLGTKVEIEKWFKDNNIGEITLNDTTKDLIIKNETNNNDKNSAQLIVNYDNNSTLSLGKVSGLSGDGVYKTYYCKDNCYNYKNDRNGEIKDNSHSKKLDYKNCNGSKCTTISIDLPDNKYASFTIESQDDFYQQKKYQTDVLSGLISEVDGKSNNSNKTPIADYSYPVSNNTKTGSYDISYKLTNTPTTDKIDINYACKYNVYNRTVLYDCKITDENGNIDLSKCNDSCYEIRDGVAVVKDSCVSWQQGDIKQYGFIYRSVDLANLFPNGINSRTLPINWSDKIKEIKDIEATASEIFSNQKYLEYRFVLTPKTIKEIKKYNKEQKSNGGYTNNTLVNCDMVKNGDVYEFRNCESIFLTQEIKKYSGIEISGNKAGGK